MPKTFLSGEANTRLGNSAAKILAKSLPEQRELRELSLPRQNIGVSGLESLIEVLKKRKLLTKLDLSGNRIGSLGIWRPSSP